MKDPAVGRSKAERAFGKSASNKIAEKTVAKKATTGVNTKKASALKRINKSKETRVNHLGQFDGPRSSYGKYNVSEQASDILNRSMNRKGTK